MKQSYFGLFIFFICLGAGANQPVPQLSFDDNDSGHIKNRGFISMTVLTEKDIKQCQACSLTDLLEKVRGRPLGSLASSGSEQPIVLVDGVRRRKGFGLWGDWVHLHRIHRVEIIRNSLSGIGDIIHIFTKRKSLLSDRSQGSGSYAEDAPYNEENSLYFKSEINKDKYALESFSYRSGFTNQALDYERDDPDLSVMNMGTTWYLSPDLLFKAGVGWSEEQSGPEWKDYKRRQLSIKLFGEYHFDFNDGDYTLTMGVGQENRFLDHGNRDFKEQERINLSGFSLTDDQIDIKRQSVFADLVGQDDPLSYQVSVRMEDLTGQKKEKSWFWSALASYRMAEVYAHDVFLKGGIKGDSPSKTDDFLMNRRRPFLSLDPFGAHRSQWNHSTEESLTYQLGLRIERNRHIFLDVSAFETKWTNSQTRSGELKENFSAIDYLNPFGDEGSTVQGLEFQMGLLWEPWEWRAQYVYTDTEQTDWLTGGQFVRHLGSVRLNYSPFPRFSIGTVYSHQNQDFFKNSDWNRLDVYSFYDVNKNAQLGLILQNAANESYEYHEPLQSVRSLFAKEHDRVLWLRLEIQH